MYVYRVLVLKLKDTSWKTYYILLFNCSLGSSVLTAYFSLGLRSIADVGEVGRQAGRHSDSQLPGQVRLQLTVSQSVCLGVEPHLGLMTRLIVSWLCIMYLFICSLFKDAYRCSD
jgi:hypothetical protein